MKTVSSAASLARSLAPMRKKGRIGFVPTMGALHDGHLSLVRRALKENRSVVVSIFVNPLQFGPKEDLKRYPRPLSRDKRLLKKAGTHLLFTPSVGTLYPEGFQTEVKVRELSKGLCGRSRPAHFAGVATVVLKLLNLVRPDTLYLGRKDYQQYRIIERLVRDLALPVKVRPCPIVREKDGLAMSSRNVFLSPEERREAAGILRALERTSERARRGERSGPRLRSALAKDLRALKGARLDYAELVDAATLEPVVQLKVRRPALAAAAVYFSKTRLIDNRLIEVER